jgi:hypothetical protein
MRVESVWSEEWKDPATWLADLEYDLRRRGVLIFRGGDFDRWDLQLSRGMFASTRLMLAIEEHGGGRQLARVKMWPRFSRSAGVVAGLAALLAAAAAFEREWITAVVLAGVFAVIGIRAVQECASCMRAVSDSVRSSEPAAESSADDDVLRPSHATA